MHDGTYMHALFGGQGREAECCCIQQFRVTSPEPRWRNASGTYFCFFGIAVFVAVIGCENVLGLDVSLDNNAFTLMYQLICCEANWMAWDGVVGA